MSSEEIKSFKEEIYSSNKQFEQKVLDTINIKIAQLTDNYDMFNEKLESIILNNRNVIESIVSEKINVEKLSALESFKNKADGMLIAHEIRINNNNKDINYMKEKYDRAIEDNLIVPGLVGPKCQYQNVKEYINTNNSEVSRLKYEKDQIKLETKDYKSRFDNLFKQTISLVDNSVDRSRDFTNTRIAEIKKYLDKKVDEFNARADGLRLTISLTKDDIEAQVNDLKLETEKIKNFLETTKVLEQSINKINDDIMKVNYEINKLYDKNNSFDKKLIELKNEMSKIKVMSEIKNKSRNIQNTMKIREPMELNTFENIRKEMNIYNSYKDPKIFSEKKEIKTTRNNQSKSNIREKKIDFNLNNNINNQKNQNQEEKKIQPKTKFKTIREKDNKMKLNMLINKHIENKIKKNGYNIDDDKSETILSEGSLINDNIKETKDIVNINEFAKTMTDNRTNLKNEDIININHNFKEGLNKVGFSIDSNNNNINFSPKKSKLIEKRVSEIKFDLKTRTLKKKIYDITSESTFFPNINPSIKPNNIISHNQNLMISNNQNENIINNNNIENNANNSISIESNENNNIDSINNKIEKRKENNENNNKKIKSNIKQKSIINNNNNIKQKEHSKSISISIKNLNEINHKIDPLPSYRSSQKFEINSEPLMNNYKNKNENSPRYFEENKYLLTNNKKIKKKLNLSHLQDKKINTKINSNIFNDDNNFNLNINQMYYSPSDYPKTKGINYVGLNNDYRKNSSDEEDINYDANKEPNLKLESIGIPLSNISQKPTRKKVNLQGISTEPPLKISAAFGRTMYSFIDKNNTKKIYSIKTIKKKSENEKMEKLDVYLGSNNIN